MDSNVWVPVRTMADLYPRDRERCGRPSSSGSPCRSHRMPAITVTAGGQVERLEPAACSSHATDAERLEHAYAEALSENRHRDYHAGQPVACWSWPVTEEHRRRAAEANACPDPDQADLLAGTLLSDWQAGRCAVCGHRSQVDDHDHQTGLIRGELCRSCNTLEAFAKVAGNAFARYRARNPASILGLTIRYYSPVRGWAEPAPLPGDPWADNPMRGVGL